MEKVKTFFKERTVEYWLMAGAFVCGLVAMILYFAGGVTQWSTSLWASVYMGYIVFVILAAAMLVYELRIVKYLAAAFALYSFAMYIVFEINFLSAWIYAIDPISSSVISTFWATTIFSVIAFGLAMASAVMTKSGLAKEKKEKKAKKTDVAAESEEAKA